MNEKPIPLSLLKNYSKDEEIYGARSSLGPGREAPPRPSPWDAGAGSADAGAGSADAEVTPAATGEPGLPDRVL